MKQARGNCLKARFMSVFPSHECQKKTTVHSNAVRTPNKYIKTTLPLTYTHTHTNSPLDTTHRQYNSQETRHRIMRGIGRPIVRQIRHNKVRGDTCDIGHLQLFDGRSAGEEIRMNDRVRHSLHAQPTSDVNNRERMRIRVNLTHIQTNKPPVHRLCRTVTTRRTFPPPSPDVCKPLSHTHTTSLRGDSEVTTEAPPACNSRLKPSRLSGSTYRTTLNAEKLSPSSSTHT